MPIKLGKICGDRLIQVQNNEININFEIVNRGDHLMKVTLIVLCYENFWDFAR